MTAIAALLASGCGGSVVTETGQGQDAGSGGSAGAGGAQVDGSAGAAGSGGALVDASKDGTGSLCSSTADCAPDEWCNIEPAGPGMCSSGGKAGTCERRPALSECPDYDQCPGACACDGTWFCAACEAHAAGLSVTADSWWCKADGGTTECAPGFCQDAVMSSCGPGDYMPSPGTTCSTASGTAGYCCFPSCGGFGGLPCPAGTWCYYPPELGPACGAVDNQGMCQSTPTGCDDNCPGVCGCDGAFYCNACVAHQAGQDISDSTSCMADGGLPFPAQLEGIWLIGWSGGMNHYSWVRFDFTDPMAGPAYFLAGEDLAANSPYWPCTGQGQWMVTAKPDTVGLTFPDSCVNQGFEALTFLSFYAPGGYPPNAVLAASIESLTAPSVYLEGYKFPSSQCNAGMTNCADPFGW